MEANLPTQIYRIITIMSNNTQHGWLRIDEVDSLFYNLHYSTASKNNTKAIILIGPIGPEYMHCHRSIKCLANNLAEKGFHTLRFDPIGMGNSTADLKSELTHEKWPTSLSILKSFLIDELNIDDVIFIALRSGSLILSKYMETTIVNYPVFWFPYINGKRFVRDILIIDNLLKLEENYTTDKGQPVIHGGGYPFTLSSQEYFKHINILESTFNNGIESLLIEDSETPPNSKFIDKLTTHFNTTKELSSGLSEMIQQAGFSVIPEKSFDIIYNWLNATFQKSVDNISTDNINTPLTTPAYNEKAIEIKLDNRMIMGIFTNPENNAFSEILLLVNAGSAHHVGPNNLNVELARQAAESNIASFRFDLSNLGDSNYSADPEINTPYPAIATEDINSVISYINKNYSCNLILAGLCSGAHNMFHAILNSNEKNITKLILINPLTFYWKPGQSINAPEENSTEIDETYYSNQILDIKKWLYLITNPVKVMNISMFLVKYFLSKIKSLINIPLTRFNLKNPSRLDSDLINVINMNIKISFLYSDGDPGYKILKADTPIVSNKYLNTENFKVIKINNSDHTFSSIESRESLINSTLNCIR